MNSSLLFNSSEDVVEIQGRWFITAGRRGFNLPRNNGRGYDSQELARKAMERLDRKAAGR